MTFKFIGYFCSYTVCFKMTFICLCYKSLYKYRRCCVIVFAETNVQRTVFLFGGQGALWHAVGREMIEHEPLFRETIVMISNLLKSIGETWSLLDELHACPSNSRLSQANIGQPATFAVQYATAKLLMSWGLVPAAVIGHSLGEYAAACTVGAITVEEALRLVLLRSKLHENCPTNGGMAAIGSVLKDFVVMYQTFFTKPPALCWVMNFLVLFPWQLLENLLSLYTIPFLS